MVYIFHLLSFLTIIASVHEDEHLTYYLPLLEGAAI